MQSTETLHRDDDRKYEPFEHRQVSKPTTTFGTFVHMVKGSFGTGIMAMPLAFKLGGLVFGSIGTITVCFIYVYCVHLLVGTSHKACKRSKIPLLGFAETVNDVFINGPQCVRPFASFVTNCVDIGILIDSFLTVCLYIIFVAKSLRDVIFNLQDTDWDTRIYILLLMIPLALLFQVRELKYLVPFSAIANVLMITSVGITLYFIFSEPISLTDRNLWPQWSTVPSFVSTALFAIQGINYVLPVENQMQHPEDFLSRFGVMNTAIGFLMVLYGVTGFFGYARYGEDTKGSVTLNLPADNALAESTRLLPAIAILFSMGLSFHVLMEILWRRIEHRVSLAWQNWTQIAVRLTVVLLLAAVAVGAPEIEPFVGLVGSLSGGTLAVLTPVTLDSIFRWPNDFGRMKWLLVKNAALYMFGLFVLCFGTYFSVKDIVAIYEKD